MEINSKGFSNILIGIVALTVFVAIVLTVFFLKIHVVRILEYKFEHSLSYNYLISLFLDRNITELLGNFGRDIEKEDVVREKIENSLDKWIKNGCFEMYFDGRKIIEKDESCEDELKNKIDIEIALPYNPHKKLFKESSWWFR